MGSCTWSVPACSRGRASPRSPPTLLGSSSSPVSPFNIGIWTVDNDVGRFLIVLVINFVKHHLSCINTRNGVSFCIGAEKCSALSASHILRVGPSQKAVVVPECFHHCHSNLYQHHHHDVNDDTTSYFRHRHTYSSYNIEIIIVIIIQYFLRGMSTPALTSIAFSFLSSDRLPSIICT